MKHHKMRYEASFDLRTLQFFAEIFTSEYIVLTTINIERRTSNHILSTMIFFLIGQLQNPGRQASIGAGLPKEVPTSLVNMLCGSGLRSVCLGAQAIACSEADIVIAGGQESMSKVCECLLPSFDETRALFVVKLVFTE